NSLPAASAPALTVCQNWCVVPLGTTAILRRSPSLFVPVGEGAGALVRGAGVVLSWLVSRTQPAAASDARARIQTARVFIAFLFQIGGPAREASSMEPHARTRRRLARS